MMPMRVDWRVVSIWTCFVARLAFYSSMLPLWEGYDEWAHFSVIRYMAVDHQALVARDAPAPHDVEASLQLAPVPWELRELPPPSLTDEAFWALPAEARAQREAAFRNMPRTWSREPGSGAFRTYEALQPPLYYWMMTPALRLLNARGLAVQVMMLRWLSVLVASLAIPLIFAVGRLVLDERLALGCAAIVALMPGVALDVARVGNDCLSMVLFSVLAWLAVRLVTHGWTLESALMLGCVLGLGLLTKAYFLTAIPAFAILWLWELRAPRAGRNITLLHGLLAGALSAAIAGWWYLRNLQLTGTLSGLNEAVMIGHAGPAEMFRQAASLNWAKAIDAILFSHLYFGGWSSLTARSWMYHLFYLVILVAAVGLVWKGRRRETGSLALLYGAFWAGQCYNVILLYMSKGLAGSMGWYLDAVVAAEVVLAMAGLSRVVSGRWAILAGSVLFGLLDLYTMHFIAVPYYCGVIRHKSGGAVAALHLGASNNVGFRAIAARLTAFKPFTWQVLLVLWIGYLAGTAFLIWRSSLPVESE
jgi:4-amino-4-deoxy-L-arabinose transferase-like glycosyltransferase